MSDAPIDLCLMAPYNQEVYLTASWNQWQRQPMVRGEDGWWHTTAQLPDGDHQYKFVVKSRSYFAKDQVLEVFDPYGLSITDDDQERTILQVRNAKRCWVDYQWRHDDKPLATNDRLVIYEMHVGDFTGGKGDEGAMRLKGKFSDAIEKLDYLADLGVNALELMPVKEFPGKSWGYNLRSLFAVDSGYGSPADLCRLVDECHARSIRVIIDGVYNHAEADCPLARIDYEYWFYRNNPDPPCMQWGPKFNYSYYDEKLKVFPARKYVIESIMYWVDHFHIDGIRFDATSAIRDFNVMREFTDAAFKKIDGRKPFFTVAEHIPEDPAIVGYPKAGPMVAAWHESFAKQLQAIATRHDHDGARPWDLDALELRMNPAANGFGSGNHTVNYVGSHDHERILKQIADESLTFGPPAFRRVKLATALLLTSPGLPMIWMGQEMGVSTPKTMAPRPIDWALLANQDNRDLRDFTARLARLRTQTPALCSDRFSVVMKDKQRHLFAYKRWDDGGDVFLIVANLEDAPAGEVAIANAGLEDGPWHDHLSNTQTQVTGGVLKHTLGPSEVKVFRRRAAAG